MEIKELDLKEMQKIHTERMAADFPPDELRPFSSIQQLTQAGLYRSFGCFEEGLAGYATFALAQNGPAVLLDYYAVDASRRGQGIGSRFLPALRGEAGRFGARYFMIEVESLETAQSPEQVEERTRRIRFYKGCGCRETRVYSYLFGVEYQILTFPLEEGAEPSDEEVEQALMSVYRTIVPPMVGPSEEAFAEVCRVYRHSEASR